MQRLIISSIYMIIIILKTKQSNSIFSCLPQPQSLNIPYPQQDQHCQSVYSDKDLTITIIKAENKLQRVMNKLNVKLQNLRSSQKFLSKEQMNVRRFKFCCCGDEEIQREEHYASVFSMSPQAKISIKKMNKREQKGNNHSNSQFSLSKQSHRSNIPSKKASQSNAVQHSGNISDKIPAKSMALPQQNNIKFVYTNRNNENKSSNYNITNCIYQPPYFQAFPIHAPHNNAKGRSKITAKCLPIDESLEKEFNNILDFGNNAKQEYSYGQPFPLDNPQSTPKIKNAFTTMPNFSFGQNQKEQFMSKYLNIKHETSHEKIVVMSSKENSKKSQLFKEIIEEKQSKKSKSSKSSGQIFIRGTFNKNTLNGLAKKRDLLYEFKSQSELSIESSQSLVLETYQSIMKKRGSFIRDYQY